MSGRHLSRATSALAAALAAALLPAGAAGAAAPAGTAAAAAPTPAGPAVVAPDAFVNQQIDALNGILARDKASQLPALRAHFKDVLDFSGFAQAALADRYAKLTDKQRLGVKDALQELLESRYLVGGSRKPFDRNKVALGAAKEDGELAQVDGKVKQSEVDVQFVLKMRRFKQSWKVYDVIIDGLSLQEDYRSQFATFLKKNSVDDLIARLHSRAQSYREAK